MTPEVELEVFRIALEAFGFKIKKWTDTRIDASYMPEIRQFIPSHYCAKTFHAYISKFIKLDTNETQKFQWDAETWSNTKKLRPVNNYSEHYYIIGSYEKIQVLHIPTARNNILL